MEFLMHTKEQELGETHKTTCFTLYPLLLILTILTYFGPIEIR